MASRHHFGPPAATILLALWLMPGTIQSFSPKTLQPYQHASFRRQDAGPLAAFGGFGGFGKRPEGSDDDLATNAAEDGTTSGLSLDSTDENSASEISPFGGFSGFGVFGGFGSGNEKKGSSAGKGAASEDTSMAAGKNLASSGPSRTTATGAKGTSSPKKQRIRPKLPEISLPELPEVDMPQPVGYALDVGKGLTIMAKESLEDTVKASTDSVAEAKRKAAEARASALAAAKEAPTKVKSGVTSSLQTTKNSVMAKSVLAS